MALLCIVFEAYIVVCIVRVAMSWLNMDEGGGILVSIGQISYALTEPVFRMIRSRLPTVGDLPIDFSPAIVIIILSILRQITCSLG